MCSLVSLLGSKYVPELAKLPAGVCHQARLVAHRGVFPVGLGQDFEAVGFMKNCAFGKSLQSDFQHYFTGEVVTKPAFCAKFGHEIHVVFLRCASRGCLVRSGRGFEEGLQS